MLILLYQPVYFLKNNFKSSTRNAKLMKCPVLGGKFRNNEFVTDLLNDPRILEPQFR